MSFPSLCAYLERAERLTRYFFNFFFVCLGKVPLPDSVQMTNRGTGLSNRSLILINSGRGESAPSTAFVNPHTPNIVTVVLNKLLWEAISSLNDIKVHLSGKLFFTDMMYVCVFYPSLSPNQRVHCDRLYFHMRS